MARERVACVVLVGVVIAGCGNSTPQPQQSVSGPRLTERVSRDLDAKLREKVAETGIPGASAAVVFPDGREWQGAAGHAVLEPEQAMTSRTSLPFDSVTKVATAALALRLAERGRLRLDDPIRRWYPAWRGDSRATVRDLLGHTSGANDPRDLLIAHGTRHPRSTVTPRQFIAASPKPGPRTGEARYSDTGFVIAGLVLQRAAGEPIAAAMRREVFGHPGGDGLAFQPAERTHPPRARSYWYPKGAGDAVMVGDGGDILPTRAFASGEGTAGALAGDVPSLARWGNQLLSGEILNPTSLQEMTRFRRGGFWEAYGLGLARDSIDGISMWGHSGNGLGTFTEFWHLPKQRVTIAMTWNDALLDRDGRILPALLRVALGSE